ncbi:hypothetical protein ANN_20664 [Periplaneta americana]|uniref:Uncharacterized protein n=1 Tax=Periplaneta americana TaxID=6978 RepID=A0ABQ8SE04_PERAM|nr:hypothetical protein ANN_20664 [Periplaneta americana]
MAGLCEGGNEPSVSLKASKEEEKKELTGPVAKKKLPSERCNGGNGKRKKKFRAKEDYHLIDNMDHMRRLRGRRCLSEIETLGNVLGACPYGETLRIHRHHAIRTKLADAIRKLKYTVYEEVHGTADNGSNRRIDIIAISESLSQYDNRPHHQNVFGNKLRMGR